MFLRIKLIQCIGVIRILYTKFFAAHSYFLAIQRMRDVIVLNWVVITITL